MADLENFFSVCHQTKKGGRWRTSCNEEPHFPSFRETTKTPWTRVRPPERGPSRRQFFRECLGTGRRVGRHVFLKVNKQNPSLHKKNSCRTVLYIDFSLMVGLEYSSKMFSCSFSVYRVISLHPYHICLFMSSS